MLHRHEKTGLIVISQPAHAWLSGQLSRAWGNEQFGRFEPHEDVCLAAALHDIGWLRWEAAPTLNRATGLPHSFRDLSLQEHIATWSPAGATMATFSRYAALLVSLHGSGLFARRDQSKETASERIMHESFAASQDSLQQSLIASLRDDPAYAAFVSDDAIERNRRLIWTWDWMSLLICMGFDNRATIENVPARDGNVSITMNDAGAGRIWITPWPFGTANVKLKWEGRRLHGRLQDEREMRRALEKAPWLTLAVQLEPRSG